MTFDEAGRFPDFEKAYESAKPGIHGSVFTLEMDNPWVTEGIVLENSIEKKNMKEEDSNSNKKYIKLN